jgi:hypothetical protein
MLSTSNVQNIENLNGDNFHTWKMKMEFLSHEKDLWEITSRKLLPLEVEFGDIVLEGGTFKHHLFMKKDKLAHGRILLNVIDFLLHHVTCVEITKDAWDNLCATFERKHVGNKL